MGGKDDAPDPPDFTELAQASVESSEIWAEVQREQLIWAREQSAQAQEVLERVLDVQLPQLDAAFQQAQADRRRYEEVFQPLENNLIREFENYDTEQRREAEAARRIADVRTQFDAQRENATQRLADYGIDPSQLRSQALDLGVRAQEAAAGALSANQGREQVRQMGRALRGEAINIGRGMPAQVATAQGIVNQTGAGAVGNASTATSTGVNALQGALQAGQMSQQGLMNASNIQNSGYQNQLAATQMNNDNTRGTWDAIGGVAGAAMGMMMQDGGEVPQGAGSPAINVPGSTDNVPAVLTEGEFIIPKDVVMRKGTEFFDKLLEKYRDGGEYENKKQGGTPGKKPQSPPRGPIPEDLDTINAQVLALQDPNSGKDTMLITEGSPLPNDELIGDGVYAVDVTGPMGTQDVLLTTDPEKAEIAANTPMTEELLSHMLYGRPGGKANSDGTVYQSLDSRGLVASEFMGSRRTALQDTTIAERLAPTGGKTRAIPLQQALAERAQRTAVS